MIALHVAFHAFGTEHSAVDWKILPRLEPDHLIFANLELNPALLPAKATVCLYELLRRMARLALPSARRFVFHVRAIAIKEQRFVKWRLCHYKFLSLSWL